jgi:hypothetical protein
MAPWAQDYHEDNAGAVLRDLSADEFDPPAESRVHAIGDVVGRLHLAREPRLRASSQ